MTRPLAALGLAALLTLAPSARSGDATLAIPEQSEIGQGFITCIDAPEGDLVFLVASTSPGPTPTKFGPLSVGFPLLGVMVFVMPAESPVCWPHVVDCDPVYVGVPTYWQYVSLGPGGFPDDYCVSNSATLTIIDGDCEPSIAAFTIGGWGQNCGGSSDSSPGCYRDLHFDDVFPGGLILGDPDGDDDDGFFAIELTSSQAVADFLPDGGPSKLLDDDRVDPGSTEAGNWAGQMTAAKLNLGFDDAGLFDAIKDHPEVKLGDMLYDACVHPALIGQPVRQVLAQAERILSGQEALPAGMSHSDFGNALDQVNNGETSCFVLP